jgi:NAD(P)-dependent dehydrogenase (short-subunit alcohol dehydrogenase family)
VTSTREGTALLAGRRALVTGGAQGIGAAVAARFAELGATGVVLDLAAPPAADLPAGWSSVAADVRDEASLSAAVRSAHETLGGVDAVVAAAGVVPSWQRPAELDLADFERVLAINTLGVAATVKHVAPLLGSGATLTVVASLNSWRGDPNIMSYVASKHAALGIVRSAAPALGPQGVRVNAVAPGPIATEALRGRMSSRREQTGLSVDAALAAAAAATALGRIATVAEVVETIVFLTSAMSSGLTGQVLNVDCGIG